MAKLVLVTGGAGFIGSHVTDLLLSGGYSVRILDNLSPQVHGAEPDLTEIKGRADIIVGDVRDPDAVERSLVGVDAVIHLAAAVGVGQSMYEIVSYTQVNEVGTAILLGALSRHRVERLVVASSMSVYGEGLARRADGATVVSDERSLDQLRRGAWEPLDESGMPLTPLPTPETKPPSLSSVYALNKYNQERLSLIVGKAYGIPTIALRFFNVYGPGQALSNPYTGVLAIFAARLLNRRPPLVFEDGQQRRDFVHVRDVARACLLALETKTGTGDVYNVGSGESRSILSVGEELADVLGMSQMSVQITGKYRMGDIRHCFANVEKSRVGLEFVPRVDFRSGLEELAGWLSDQIAVDRVDRATAELERRGLVG